MKGHKIGDLYVSFLKIIYKLTYPFAKLYWKLCKPTTYGSRALLLCNNQVLLVKNINVQH
jgi:hypothetical protein